MKRTFIFALCSFLMVSCTDFLKETTPTGLSEDTVYDTEASLEANIYGCLYGFYGSYMPQGYQMEMIHTASGLLAYKGARDNDQWVDGLKFAKYSNSGPAQNVYTQHYGGIGKCNRLLDNLPDSPVDPAFKAEIEGEAKLYRAIHYFYLVRFFGDVPLLTSSPRNFEQTNNPRTVYYKVYAQIISDLNDAERLMRDQAKVDAVSPGKGRPCKWAATAFKSTVYLTIASLLKAYEADPNDLFFDLAKDASRTAAGKDPHKPDFSAIGIATAKDAWQLAYDTAEKVIAEGPYSLCPDYRKLFRWTYPEDFTLSERIFVLQSTTACGEENRLANMSLPAYAEGSCNTIKNSNTGRWRPNRFMFQKFAENNGGIKGTGSENKDIFVDCEDPRFAASFYYESYIRSDNGATAYVYPHNGKVIADITSACANPYCKKYLDPTWDCNAGNADLYVLRLGEIYLISAEAAANLSSAKGDGMWQKALARVEDIHSRARKSTDGAEAAFPTWSGRDFADQKELCLEIFWERVRELNCEGHEYFDTHRYGAKWLGEVMGVELNKFLQLREQNSMDDEGYGGVWKYLYNGVSFPTSQADCRKSLLCGFPTTVEALNNTAINIEEDQNDYFWQ